MEWTPIVVAVITAISAFIGVYFSNRKAAALIEYRLEQLERKVDKHNHFADRIVHLEQFEALQEEKNKQYEEAIR